MLEGPEPGQGTDVVETIHGAHSPIPRGPVLEAAHLCPFVLPGGCAGHRLTHGLVLEVTFLKLGSCVYFGNGSY